MAVAPTGPKKWLTWFPLNVGTALALSVVLSVAAFLLLSDGENQAGGEGALVAALADSAELIQEGPSSPIPETGLTPTTLSAVATGGEGGDRGGADDAVEMAAPGSELGAATPVVVELSSSEFGFGPTEVALVTNFPAVAYEWERVVLPSSDYLDIRWIGELSGRLMAVGSSWDESSVGDPGPQTLVAWAPGDESVWVQLSAVALPAETWISRVIEHDGRVYALTEQYGGQTHAVNYTMMTTEDGITWTTEALPLTTSVADEHVYLQDAAVGSAGMALSLQYETYPPEPPQRLIFDDYQIELDYTSDRYVVTENASGDVVLTGPMDDIYNGSDVDGQRIWDPASGEILTVVPRDVWEQAYAEAYEGHDPSPLPIPVGHEEAYEPVVVTVEHDGYVVTIDEGTGTYTVVDAASGDEVASASLDILFQGPPPVFVDRETGETILSVTWDEWYQAQERGWESNEYIEPEFEYSSRTVLVTSPDGETWSEEIISDGSHGVGVSLVATGDGFMALATSYGDGGEQRTVWRMVDGVWTATEADQVDMWLHNVKFAGDGLVAVGDGPSGQAFWSSVDGISWATEFAVAPQSEGEHVWFNSVAVDGDGLVGVLATREATFEFEPLVIEQDRYTAVFEDGETAVRITETVSGTEVLVLTWEDFDLGSAAEIITREENSTVFALGNGEVMVITDEEAVAMVDQRFGGSAYTMESSVFLQSDTGWHEVVVDSGAGLNNASQLFVGGDRIVVAGNHWSGYATEFELPQTQAVILIGTPAGGEG